jgi:hypothetical protein
MLAGMVNNAAVAPPAMSARRLASQRPLAARAASVSSRIAAV